MIRAFSTEDIEAMYTHVQTDVFDDFLKQKPPEERGIFLNAAMGRCPSSVAMLEVLVRNLPQETIASWSAHDFLNAPLPIDSMGLVLKSHPDPFLFLNNMGESKQRPIEKVALSLKSRGQDGEAIMDWMLGQGAVCTPSLLVTLASSDANLSPVLAHRPPLNQLHDHLLPLHCAVISGHINNAKQLLQAGADVNARDGQFSTAILHSLDPEMTRLMLKHGADPMAVNKDGENLLMAILKNKPNIFDAVVEVIAQEVPHCMTPLLSHKNKANDTVLHTICRQPFAEFDLSKFFSGEIGPTLVNQKNDLGETPLMASCSGWGNTCHALIEAGADLNAVDFLGDTALIRAVRMHQPDVCERLLVHGADANIVNRSGQSALDCAIECATIDCIPHLVAMGGVMAKDPRLLKEEEKSRIPKYMQENRLVTAMRTNSPSFLQFMLKSQSTWTETDFKEAKKFGKGSSKRANISAVLHSHCASLAIDSVIDKCLPTP